MSEIFHAALYDRLSSRSQMLVLARVAHHLGQRADNLQELADIAGDYVQAINDRLDTIERASLIQIDVVQTLPQSAPVTRWFRKPADPNVYVGNGAGQPLRKISTGTIS